MTGPASIACSTSERFGCGPKSLRHQVAPASIQGPAAVPAGFVDHIVEGSAAGTLVLHLRAQLGQRRRLRHLHREEPVPARGPPQRPAVGPGSGHPHRDARSLHRTRLELAVPIGAQTLEAVVEQARTGARVALLPEALGIELAGASAAEAHAQHEPPAAEAVERDRLAGQLVRAAPAQSASRADRSSPARWRRRPRPA